MIAIIRATLFNLVFYGATGVMSVLYLPLLLLPRKIGIELAAQLWTRYTLFMAHVVCGMKMEVRGEENKIKGPVIYAAKHQSAWDTIALTLLLMPKPAFVLKRSLLFIPLFGLYLMRIGCLAIDRSSGASAIKQMVRQGKELLDDGHTLVIFPEGTRTDPGATDTPFHPGVSALYTQLNVPVVPVALNSGVCWGRNAVMKKPGTIVVEFLPAIEPGLDRKTFMRTLKEKIDTHSKALLPAN